MLEKLSDPHPNFLYINLGNLPSPANVSSIFERVLLLQASGVLESFLKKDDMILKAKRN